MDRMIDVTAIKFLLVQNRQQTHDWTLIGSGSNGIGKKEWYIYIFILKLTKNTLSLRDLSDKAWIQAV